MAGDLVSAGAVSLSDAMELTPRQVGFLHDRMMQLQALRDSAQMTNLLTTLAAMRADGQAIVEEHLAALRAGAGIEVSGYTGEDVLRF